MEDSEKVARPPAASARASTGGILFLVALLLVTGAAWPAFRTSVRGGLRAITRPFSPRGSEDGELASRARGPAEKLAVQVRSMEFRLQQYLVDPARLREWSAEWQIGPSQQLALLRQLLRQLPEAAARDTSPIQRRNLIQSILDLCAEGHRSQPDNGYDWLAESLALLYSGQDAASILALRQAQRCPKMDAGLRELNQSEHALWKGDTRFSTLLPVTHRAWGLGLERPLQSLSRSLALQERALLQKYNFERAVDLGLLHLGLAVQLLEAGWTPADHALARGIANRALEPFWSQRGKDPTTAELETNFVSFLEDQGDKLSAAKARAAFSQLADKEKNLAERLPRWRSAQQLSIWNASSVLGSLLLQTASLFLVWATLALALRGTFTPSFPDSFETRPASTWLDRRSLAGSGLAAGPLCWTFSAWPPGGTWLLLGLLGGWAIGWGLLILARTRLTMASLCDLTGCALVTLLTATLLTAGAIGAALQYRTQQIEFIAGNGWLR